MNYLIHPKTGQKISLFSKGGKHLLKQMIQSYNYLKQHGGMNNNGENDNRKEIESDFTIPKTEGFSEEKEVKQEEFGQKLDDFLTVNKTNLSGKKISDFKNYAFEQYENSNDENLELEVLFNNYINNYNNNITLNNNTQ